MKAARQRALGFVELRGDAAALGRARALAGEAPLEDALAGLALPGTLPEALALLGALDDLGALYAPLAENAVAWVEGRQSGDGSWEGELFATGMLAGHLGKTPYARPAGLEGAAAWLAAAWAPERVRSGDWQAIAAFAHFFAVLPHELSDEALQWCGRELERGHRVGRFDALAAARVLLWCDARAIPGARLGADELLAGVLGAQLADGGWPAPSPQARVGRTLDALALLSRWS